MEEESEKRRRKRDFEENENCARKKKQFSSSLKFVGRQVSGFVSRLLNLLLAPTLFRLLDSKKKGIST